LSILVRLPSMNNKFKFFMSLGLSVISLWQRACQLSESGAKICLLNRVCKSKFYIPVFTLLNIIRLASYEV